MKYVPRLLLLTFTALLLTACPQQQAEEPVPLKLAWQRVLLTPDQVLLTYTAANDDYVYVFDEELPLDDDYGKKWAALWRVDAHGEVMGPVKFPDDEAAAELAENGFACPQPIQPLITVDKSGNVYTSIGLRNTDDQQVGCDTYDGSWANSGWSAFGTFNASLQRTGLAWLKSFGDDDPTYSGVFSRVAGLKDHAIVRGAYQSDTRISPIVLFSGRLEPDGELSVNIDDGNYTNPREVFDMPEGWLEMDIYGGIYIQASDLARYDEAGKLLWRTSINSEGGFPPIEYTAGIPGEPGTVFVSGVAGDGDTVFGFQPPEDEFYRAPFVARLDGGQVTWFRWITEDEDYFKHLRNTYFEVPLVYDPAYDELYLAIDRAILALDPASGETRWLTTLDWIVDGEPVGLSDWFTLYQPQPFQYLFLVDGSLVALCYSWWDTYLGHGTDTDRYRPMLMRFDRTYEAP